MTNTIYEGGTESNDSKDMLIASRYKHKCILSISEYVRMRSWVSLYFWSSFWLGANCGCLWRRQWHPTPVLLPGQSHGWRSLVGCSPRGREELDTTEWLHFDFSLSCIGEGNGNPLQCSCLENPRDGGAWWSAIYGVAQSRTWLKWLSSSSGRLRRLEWE